MNRDSEGIRSGQTVPPGMQLQDAPEGWGV